MFCSNQHNTTFGSITLHQKLYIQTIAMGSVIKVW